MKVFDKLINTVLGRSFLWLFLSIVFGQIQLWVVWASASMSIDRSLSYDKIMLDGYILFFCTGITTSLALDYYFTNKYLKRNELLQYSLLPVVILAFSTIIGTYIIDKDSTQINMQTIRIFHTFLIIMTTLYIITIKTKEFSKK